MQETNLRVRVIRIIRVSGGREIYCLLDAPDIETILRYHLKNGFDCDWIEEVTSLQSYEEEEGITTSFWSN